MYNYFTALSFLILTVVCFAQKPQPSMISPAEADAVIAYFQQCPESPDGKRVIFTLFHAPDTMEIVVKDIASGNINLRNLGSDSLT